MSAERLHPQPRNDTTLMPVGNGMEGKGMEWKGRAKNKPLTSSGSRYVRTARAAQREAGAQR
jgi:hypothetical protein